MHLTKQRDGSYLPSYPADKQESDKVKIGSEITASRARNPDHHRKGMALIQLAFENQDQYNNFDFFRKALLIECGFASVVIDFKGRETLQADSMRFDAMNQKVFEEFYEAAKIAICKFCGITNEQIIEEIQNYF